MIILKRLTTLFFALVIALYACGCAVTTSSRTFLGPGSVGYRMFITPSPDPAKPNELRFEIEAVSVFSRVNEAILENSVTQKNGELRISQGGKATGVDSASGINELAGQLVQLLIAEKAAALAAKGVQP